jgi:predicted Zn finger-like uncharacterized protein
MVLAMSTLIICPACETRYEIAASIPPEGRKVRCSKCAHIWQATAANASAEPANKVPQAPQAAARPAAVNPAMRQFAGITQAPQEEAVFDHRPSEAGQTDAEFGAGDDFQADWESHNDEASSLADQGREAPLPAVVADISQNVFVGPNAGVLTDPESEAAPQGESSNIFIGRLKRGARGRRAVVIGWSLLALAVLTIGAIMALAPRAVVSVLPGAARLYAMLGVPVNARGLAFEGVSYAWNNASGHPVLEVKGDVVNLTSGAMQVPVVVIALRDEAGKEISEWTPVVREEPLKAGEHAPFVAQIPSPPDTVRSLKVRFAKAN